MPTQYISPMFLPTSTTTPSSPLPLTLTALPLPSGYSTDVLMTEPYRPPDDWWLVTVAQLIYETC